MTEDEWLLSSDPRDLLAMLDAEFSDRKLRLFATGCCRMNWWHLREYGGHQDFIDALELRTDGLIGEDEFEEVRSGVQRFISRFPIALSVTACGEPDTIHAAHYASIYSAEGGGLPSSYPAHRAKQCDLFREILGNPFRPVAFDPSWRTSTAVAIAKGMYDSRDFSAMPILADALQDAGCEHADILDHCRGPGPHVRGCWVVDLVLGKE